MGNLEYKPSPHKYQAHAPNDVVKNIIAYANLVKKLDRCVIEPKQEHIELGISPIVEHAQHPNNDAIVLVIALIVCD